MSKIRVITATSLFDGHDASINIMRRIMQDTGVEVIHLGHNRSVAEVVRAALQEDAHGIAISSYQGGHVEYLKYMLDLLRSSGGEKIRIFAGGGGVIVSEEKKLLEETFGLKYETVQATVAVIKKAMDRQLLNGSIIMVIPPLPRQP